MQVLVEVTNLDNESNMADVYYKGCYMGNFSFGSKIEEYEERKNISSLIKLKDAGFSCEEIIEMGKAGLI